MLVIGRFLLALGRRQYQHGWRACRDTATPAVRSIGHHLTLLDVFRGLAITAMIVVNNPGSWGTVYPRLAHADWHGWTFADVVFPSRIGLAYAIAAPIVLLSGVRGWIAASLALLAVHTGLLSWMPFGDHGAGTMTPGHNLPGFVDAALFGTIAWAWTGSFAVAAAGVSAHAFAFCYALVDVMGPRVARTAQNRTEQDSAAGWSEHEWNGSGPPARRARPDEHQCHFVCKSDKGQRRRRFRSTNRVRQSVTSK